LVLNGGDFTFFSPVNSFTGWGVFFKNNVVFGLTLAGLVSQDFLVFSGSPVREFVGRKEIGRPIYLVVGVNNGFGLKELLVSELEFLFGPVALSVFGDVLSKFTIIGGEEAN